MQAPPATRLRSWLGPLWVGLAGMGVFLPGLAAPFTTWDDPLYVTDNARVLDRTWDGLLRLWNPGDALAGRFVEYFPLRDSVYWLLHRLFGLTPAPYHLVSFALHGLTSALLVYAVRGWMGRRDVAVLAGLLFALHPVHAESVVWIAALKDPMFGAALLGAFLAYLRAREGQRPVLLLASVGLMVASLLCKSFAIVLPPLLVGWELTRARRAPLRSMALRVLPFAAVAAAFLALYLEVGRANQVIALPSGASRLETLPINLWAMVRYCQLLLVPSGFRIAYYCLPFEAFDPRWLALIGVYGALLAGAVLAFRKSREATFLFAWFAASLLPVSNIIPFPAFMADRYLYLPSVAFCVGAAWALLAIPSRVKRLLIPALALVYLGSAGLRASQWNDEAELWKEVVEEWPSSSAAWAHLGNALVQTQRTEEGVKAFARAFATEPDGVRARTPWARYSRVNQAMALVSLGRPEEARPFARAALEVFPEARAWEALGLVEQSSRRPAEAALAYDQAIALAGKLPRLLFHRGLVRVGSGDLEGGAGDLRASLASEPSRCERLRVWARELSSKDPAAEQALFAQGGAPLAPCR